MLLSKKRDAHRALRRFVRARLENAAPLGEARSSSLLPGESNEGGTPAVPFADLFENLAKWSPTLDDKYARPEALGLHLRSLDAVRDKTLWAHLDHLLDHDMQDSTCKMSEQVCELDRLLRVHRLGGDRSPDSSSPDGYVAASRSGRSTPGCLDRAGRGGGETGSGHGCGSPHNRGLPARSISSGHSSPSSARWSSSYRIAAWRTLRPFCKH